MASAQGLFPAFPISKRSACDRCRTQKLRCLPRDLVTGSWCRCARLGSKCTTTYPRPTGRPSKASLNASQPKAPGPEQASMIVFSATQGPPSPTSLEVTNSSQPTISNTAFDPFALSTSEDALDILSFRPTLNEHLHCGPPIGTDGEHRNYMAEETLS